MVGTNGEDPVRQRTDFSWLPPYTPSASILGAAQKPSVTEHFWSLTTPPCGLISQIQTDRLACEKVLTTSASSTSIFYSRPSGTGTDRWLGCFRGCATGRVGSYIWVWWADDADQLMRC